MPSVRADRSLSGLARAAMAAVRAVRRVGVKDLARDLLGPYDALLERWLLTDTVRAPVAAFAAHGAVGPSAAGGAIYGFWQAAYHLFGQWHAIGGAQALTDALVARLRSLGGELRCGDPVVALETSAGRINGVRTAGGELLRTSCVLAAIDSKVALLQLPRPPLEGSLRADLGAAKRSNVVQGVVHVAARRLPAYRGAKDCDYRGLQSYVPNLDLLRRGWEAAADRRLADQLPLYAFTPSALDPGLAPPGAHTSRRSHRLPRLPHYPSRAGGGMGGGQAALRGFRPGGPGNLRPGLWGRGHRHLRLDPRPDGLRGHLARGPSNAPRPRPRAARSFSAHPLAGVASHPDLGPVPRRCRQLSNWWHRRHPGPPGRQSSAGGPGGPKVGLENLAPFEGNQLLAASASTSP